MTPQEQPSLADEIEIEVIDAAVKHHLGTNPHSHTLTTRERIIIDAIERFIRSKKAA